jgi:hypothetical protein
MTNVTNDGRTDGVPAGYAAVPIDTAGTSTGAVTAPVRVCVLVRRQPDPVSGRFVVVRQAMAGRAVLGCLTDAAGTLLEWLEVWVQATAAATLGGPPTLGGSTNAAADRRWDELVDEFARLGPIGGFLTSGWERSAGPALVLDPDLKRVAPPTDSQSGDAWVLCTDEAVLSAAGVPGYAASPHRYLYLPGRAGVKLIPVTAGAPETAQTTPMPAVTDGRGFNVEAGRMFLRRHGPVPLEALFDVLAGRQWHGIGHGTGVVPVGGAIESLRAAAATEGNVAPDEGRLFLGRHGRWGRVLESYHLRLRLLADMVTAVRAAVTATGRPMLSLGPDSFQARLPEPSAGMPFLWGAQVMLADPGEAVRGEVPGSDLVYFHTPAGRNASVYRPGSAARDVTGADGVMRVRQVIADAAQGAVVEGTLATSERLGRADGQLLWLRPALGSGPVDLYARLTETQPTAGEWRFRSVGQRLPAAAVRELQAAAGVPLAHVPFATVSTAAAAADLYALAVLAAQALLVDPATFPLPVVVDEVMSLARYLAEHYDAGVGLGLRVRGAFEADRRWMSALGPQRLVAEPLSPEAALDLIPIELWCDTLAAVVRMIPGVGPDSICPTWDDATAAAAPSRVFDPVLSDLDGLIRRSRSLIVIDWRFNREVRSVIRSKLAGMGNGR